MKVDRFEDLDCWKAARELVKLVYHVTRKKPFSADFGLRDQIQRSAISVMANIAEGFAAFSNVEFMRFLDYAIRSAIETQSHLYAVLDLEYIDSPEFSIAYNKAQDCANLCKGLVRHLKERT